MNNKILKNILENLPTKYLEQEELSPDIDDYFLNYDYYNLSKEEVAKMLNTELADLIVDFKVDVFDLGFQAGIDTILKFQGKDPIFGVLENLDKKGFDND